MESVGWKGGGVLKDVALLVVGILFGAGAFVGGIAMEKSRKVSNPLPAVRANKQGQRYWYYVKKVCTAGWAFGDDECDRDPKDADGFTPRLVRVDLKTGIECFSDVVADYPKDEMGWLWMAEVFSEKEKKTFFVPTPCGKTMTDVSPELIKSGVYRDPLSP